MQPYIKREPGWTRRVRIPVILSYIAVIRQKKYKLKQSLLQAWAGPEGSRKLRIPDYMTIVTRRR